MPCRDPVASVESVKAASDVYAPYAGTITAVNEVRAAVSAAVHTGERHHSW